MKIHHTTQRPIFARNTNQFDELVAWMKEQEKINLNLLEIIQDIHDRLKQIEDKQ